MDDILNRAEQHETVAANDDDSSLGGEGFFVEFASVSDVRDDMVWEDIIPMEESQWFEEDEEKRKAEELAAQSGKRRTENVRMLPYPMNGWT